MRRRPAWRTTLALLALAPAAPLAAAVDTQADAGVILLCSDADGSRHPRRLAARVPLVAGDLGPGFENRLLLGYQRDVEVTDRAKVTATVHLERADGTRLRLGRLGASFNRVDGGAVGARILGEEVAPGDALAWALRFRGAEALAAGECLAVVVGVTRPSEGCGPYPEWSRSEYVLPFRAGGEYVVSQGNCSPIGSHRFAARHAYDFAMPRGTEVLAARGGVVQWVQDDAPEDTGLSRDGNGLQILHDDGTYATYFHIARGGARVVAGERVEQGQPVAASGNAGSTGGLPHLHLQVTPCPDRDLCGTLPVTFRNTAPNPAGLELGRPYRAVGD